MTHSSILGWSRFDFSHFSLSPASSKPQPDRAILNPPARAGEEHYPPYNIERLSDDCYRISLAVAGFSPDEISVTAEQNVVTVEGNKPDKAEGEYLYRGISARPFKRQFSLADYVQVKNAAFENGLLKIELLREIPKAVKPRRIAINGTTASNVHQLEGKAA